MADHGHGFGGKGRGFPEIGQDALAQVARLAHVDDAALRILIKVDAGRDRQSGREGALHAISEKV